MARKERPGIYIFTHRDSGMQYVGKDWYLPKRAMMHLNGNEDACPRIHRAINKYGPDAFDVEIIDYPGISKETLLQVESWKIRQLNTLSPNGYNLIISGNDGVFSDETRKKMSESLKGRSRSEETKRKMSKSHKGKKMSDEARYKMSESHKGKKISEKTKCKMSESHKGKKKSDEHRRNLSLASKNRPSPMKGRRHSEETKRKISMAARNRIYS